MRKQFLTQHAVRRYISYCKKQFRIYEADVNNTIPGKRIYHTFRLLHIANNIIEGKEPEIWLKEENHREFLIKIRKDNFSKSEIIAMAEKEVNKIEAKSLSHLPPTISEEGIKKWLLDVRLASFNEKIIIKKKTNEFEKSKELLIKPFWNWHIPDEEWTEEKQKWARDYDERELRYLCNEEELTGERLLQIAQKNLPS